MQNIKGSSAKIYVYAARFPFDVLSRYLPRERQNEIDGCLNENVKNAKYYAFKLLEIALKSAYGVDIRDCGVTKDDCGKWTCDVCSFSISHCDDIAAVAVSDNPVGLDVEKIDSVRFGEKLQRRIFTKNERQIADAMTENERRGYANRIWTVKEAEFKRKGGTNFIAKQIDTATLTASETKLIATEEKDYYLSVVGDGVSEVFYFIKDLSFCVE